MGLKDLTEIERLQARAWCIDYALRSNSPPVAPTKIIKDAEKYLKFINADESAIQLEIKRNRNGDTRK